MPNPTLTLQQAAKIVQWFRGQFGLQDWTVQMFIQDDPPEWADDTGKTLGCCVSDVEIKTTQVWISLARCKTYDEDPRAVLVHELLHAALTDAGVKNDTNERLHYLINCLEKPLLTAYLAEKK